MADAQQTADEIQAMGRKASVKISAQTENNGNVNQMEKIQ
jgi:hypothetical protein